MKIVIMNFIMKIEKIDAKQEHTLLDQCANNCRESGFMDGKKADIGIIGLAVMGENLAMNMESKGFTVAVYNRTVQKVADFTEGRAKGKNIIGARSIQELADSRRRLTAIRVLRIFFLTRSLRTRWKLARKA